MPKTNMKIVFDEINKS